ncbi:GNAT family N-acetyltransferase [Paenibacillus gansuensis]|uniref:GNAT family N-acetyltransferase n=1 Tax=Paenibacillus gansuensis TaxID=306542 RepID=A0ABW5PEC2_9BACL
MKELFPYEITDAAETDMPAIVEIYNSTVAGRMVTADTEPVSVESRMKWFHEHSPDFRPLWVMRSEGVICGWLSFQSFYGRPAYNGTAEVSIYVHEQYRGKGIGKILMEQAFAACPKLGLKTLLGFIFGHNEPSLRLFRKYGFETWAHMPQIAELDGIERDLIILGKRVQP